MFSKAKPITPAPVEKPKRSSTPPSILAGDMSVKGDLFSEGDIQLDGLVNGDVRSKHVTVGKLAVINGSIIGDNLRVSGTVNGEITARVVILTSTARVTGDINHDSLSIQAGAYVQGLCKRVEIDMQKLLTDPSKPKSDSKDK